MYKCTSDNPRLACEEHGQESEKYPQGEIFFSIEGGPSQTDKCLSFVLVVIFSDHNKSVDP